MLQQIISAHESVAEGCCLLSIHVKVMWAAAELHCSHGNCPELQRILDHCFADLCVHGAALVIHPLPGWILHDSGKLSP